jgi:hypothetical protein
MWREDQSRDAVPGPRSRGESPLSASRRRIYRPNVGRRAEGHFGERSETSGRAAGSFGMMPKLYRDCALPAVRKTIDMDHTALAAEISTDPASLGRAKHHAKSKEARTKAGGRQFAPLVECANPGGVRRGVGMGRLSACSEQPAPARSARARLQCPFAIAGVPVRRVAVSSLLRVRHWPAAWRPVRELRGRPACARTEDSSGIILISAMLYAGDVTFR